MVGNALENVARLWLSGLSIHGDPEEMLPTRVLTAHPSPRGDADAQPGRTRVSRGSAAQKLCFSPLPAEQRGCQKVWLTEGDSPIAARGQHGPAWRAWVRDGSYVPCTLLEGLGSLHRGHGLQGVKGCSGMQRMQELQWAAGDASGCKGCEGCSGLQGMQRVQRDAKDAGVAMGCRGCRGMQWTQGLQRAAQNARDAGAARDAWLQWDAADCRRPFPSRALRLPGRRPCPSISTP